MGQLLSRPGDFGGVPSTFARIAVWDEAAFAYQYYVDCARHRDARPEYRALHDPPLIIVERIYYDQELTRP